MDRIKLAVEKARRLHGGARGPAQQPQRGPIQQTVGTGHRDMDSVTYRQTSVISLDPTHLHRNRIVGHDKAHPASPAFDLLRTKVQQRMEENGWRTLGITSTGPDAGKTTVAINLAMSIAHQTQKTAMLVDFDLRRPGLAASLGLPDGLSLNEVLDGSARLADVLVNPGIPRLVVLPTMRPVANSAEVLSSARVAHLITDLRERYESRIVIFDLPPLLHSDDVLTVLPKIDCIMLVVGDGLSAKAEVEECLRHLPAANFLGAVLNKADVTSKPYY